MTTLTRIRLNRMHPCVRRDLADREELHKTTMRLLPGTTGPTARAGGGLLFCLEPGLEAVLLVQTARPPHLAALPAGYGTANTLDLATMFAALTPGRAVHYRITAAPAAATSGPPDPATGRRRNTKYPLTGQPAQAWWERRATAAGLHLLGKNTATPCPFPLLRTRTSPGPYHRLVRFEGHATITDPAAVAAAVRHGIGRGKSYGAGLLCLAPPATASPT